jgi:hypothetical protein
MACHKEAAAATSVAAASNSLQAQHQARLVKAWVWLRSVGIMHAKGRYGSCVLCGMRTVTDFDCWMLDQQTVVLRQ